MQVDVNGNLPLEKHDLSRTNTPQQPTKFEILTIILRVNLKRNPQLFFLIRYTFGGSLDFGQLLGFHKFH